MITVASFDNQADAHIAKGLLEAEGLSPRLADNHLVQTDWLYSAALGGIKLQVPPGEAARARELLSQDRSGVLAGEEPGDPLTAVPTGSETLSGLNPGGVSRAALVHVAALSGALIPLGHLLGPLAVWFWHRGTDPELDAHGREAVNFQASVTLYAVIAAALLPEGGDWAVLLALFSADLVLVLLAGARARRGGFFRYPLAIPLLTPRSPSG